MFRLLLQIEQVLIASSLLNNFVACRFTASDGKMKLKALLQSSLSSEVLLGNIQNLGLIRILDYTVNDIPTKSEK